MSVVSKRMRCSRCLRPQTTCLCSLVTPVSNRVEVIILRHPMESGNAKNTATLLHLCLARCQLLEGESFDQQRLKALIDDPMYTSLLLYPETPEAEALALAIPPPLPDVGALPAERIRLWVLDASWRKSRKMLYVNSCLQHLPRLSLQQTPPSRYVIRKAHHEDQLSTLEATCYALQQLEQNRIDYQPLLTMFDQFIARHLTFLPPGRLDRTP